ncbi:MAG: acyltransferase [Chitinophagaceae bacterium]|nr:acyltransferase [Chitinophagaceae bacterium]
MSAPTLKDKYYPSLDGLRGLAIILVICFHYLGFITFFRFGWMGTDLFFVLSGFLITGRLAPYLSNKNLLSVFYRNRFLRIVPVYFSFLLMFFGVWIILSPADDNHFFRQNGWTFFLFLQNWFMIADPAASENHLQHLWSLAVEEQFYLCYPFLLLLFYRYKYFMAGLITVMVMLIATRHIFVLIHPAGLDYRTVYWNSIFRFDAFLTGTLLYQLNTAYEGK